jgi:hypothetical protein
LTACASRWRQGLYGRWGSLRIQAKRFWQRLEEMLKVEVASEEVSEDEGEHGNENYDVYNPG